MADDLSKYGTVAEAGPDLSQYGTLDVPKQEQPSTGESVVSGFLQGVNPFHGMSETIEAFKKDPVAAAKSGLLETLAHPFMALGRAWDAAKEGKQEEAAAHLSTLFMPQLEEPAVKMATPGQRAEGAAQMAGIPIGAVALAKLPHFAAGAAARGGEILGNAAEVALDPRLRDVITKTIPGGKAVRTAGEIARDNAAARAVSEVPKGLPPGELQPISSNLNTPVAAPAEAPRGINNPGTPYRPGPTMPQSAGPQTALQSAIMQAVDSGQVRKISPTSIEIKIPPAKPSLFATKAVAPESMTRKPLLPPLGERDPVPPAQAGSSGASAGPVRPPLHEGTKAYLGGEDAPIAKVVQNRARVADKIASAMLKQGITDAHLAQIEELPPSQARKFWEAIGAIHKGDYVPSSGTIDSIRAIIKDKSLQGPKLVAKPKPAPSTGPLAKNPKALRIATSLAELMQQAERK